MRRPQDRTGIFGEPELKRTVPPNPTPEAWDAESLFLKAQRYIEQMGEHDSKSWEHALWSSLSLELLARAALSNVSPALLADHSKGNWSSLFHSLGFVPTVTKFFPRSISTTEVFRRLNNIFPEFNQELESFCIRHIGKRNAELHSGEAAFDGMPESSWHPRFYKTCQVLLASMGLELEDFVGGEVAEVAKKLMAAAADDSAKAVRGDVAAHQKVWAAKEDDDRAALTESARVWATRQLGHRVECPACQSSALVVGEPISAPQMKLEDDEIIETQEYLPNHFECIACGLKILGLSRLNAIDLGDRYLKTYTYDAVEYYAQEDEFAGFEEDNNERF